MEDASMAANGIDNRDWLGLTGRVAVVTGGASGIGRACALALAAAGCRVAALDIDEAGAGETAALVGKAGGHGTAVRCDTTDPASISAARAAVVRDLGPADILVNNAGILRPGGLDSLSLADWNTLIAVNLTGYLLCAQAFGTDMRAKGKGALIHIASIAAREPQAFSGAYSVTKAGVVMLSRQLAFEWGPAGIRSNTVSPGLVRTPLSEAFYRTPGVAERRAAIVPVGRVGVPEDIADAVTFLASDRAAYVNGDDMLVDGGLDDFLMSQVPRPGFEGKG
jgi:NAD(P)-dependent dehydrogenase (short-subunit alcohol dehydrogenase family)